MKYRCLDDAISYKKRTTVCYDGNSLAAAGIVTLEASAWLTITRLNPHKYNK